MHTQSHCRIFGILRDLIQKLPDFPVELFRRRMDIADIKNMRVEPISVFQTVGIVDTWQKFAGPEMSAPFENVADDPWCIRFHSRYHGPVGQNERNHRSLCFTLLLNAQRHYLPEHLVGGASGES